MRNTVADLYTSAMAVNGVRDLLLSVSGRGGDLHLCDPEALCCLLEVISKDIKRIHDALDAATRSSGPTPA